MSQQPVTSIFDRKVFADRLTKVRNNANLTRDEVVALSNNGFARSSLQAWEVGDREPKIDNIFELAKIYGISPHYLIFGDTEAQPLQQVASDSEAVNDDEYVHIPAYDIAVSAGHGMFSDGAIKPSKYLAFRRRWVQARSLTVKCLAVLFTEGDSMIPTIPENAAIVINRERNQALDGKVYVIRIDDRLYVKRTQWIPTGGLRLISDNKAYDSFDISKQDMQANDIEICGQVIHASYDLPD
ncbi:XRE family transcriptional regulator [Psychrobacter sp. FDAARGOS_221]|uniref:XRE family transcriptional regulator n=1 Tax=Psychrobacter sp. FDAARGOS_221 TaxID=1975705 RepID=UPI000BB58C16|nr:S24 family peptidase [Psychrobacter sp. FDAARGOS_221]PNK61493.1 helix-turn-helix transcriptional regulator [Psychrobacter sp. FDAARGOS_221]